MNISVGIVGLPNTGKSTLFNALTKKEVPAENYPFCTIDPSVGVVQVPDERLEILGELSNSKEIIPSIVEFVDIAGLVRGASSGEGLGNAFLSHIREVHAVGHMVRCFINEDVTHVNGEVSPVNDIEIIETELSLADVQIVEQRLKKIEKDVKKLDKNAIAEKEILEQALLVLNEGRQLREEGFSVELVKKLNALGLLTVKPAFYIVNVGINPKDKELFEQVKQYATFKRAEVVMISAHTEYELSQLTAQEAQEMRAELLSEDAGIDSVIQTAYKTLQLISYFTTGEKETRAWAVPAGSPAPAAARAIHTDFEKNFIRAEVVSYDEFVKAASWQGARDNGVFRLEGKEYIVQDGDVILFRVGQ